MSTSVFFRYPVLRDLATLIRRPRVIEITHAFLDDDGGATMVEYAFMLMLIALVCIAAVTSIGTKLNTVYSNVANDF